MILDAEELFWIIFESCFASKFDLDKSSDFIADVVTEKTYTSFIFSRKSIDSVIFETAYSSLESIISIWAGWEPRIGKISEIRFTSKAISPITAAINTNK